MAIKALELFDAYAKDQLPREGGWIVSSFLDGNTSYGKYEVIAYSGVKGIYTTEDGLTFQSDGNKIFVLVEPPSYPKKQVEPFIRDSKEQIPHRFSELNIFKAKNQTRVMVSKQPIMTYTSFTVLKPQGINFAFIFFNLPDVYENINLFFQKTFNQEAGIPRAECKKAVDLVIEGLKKFTIW
jgi:hypothetical protein